MVLHPQTKFRGWIHAFQHYFWFILLKLYAFSHTLNFQLVLDMKHSPTSYSNSFSKSKFSITASMRLLYFVRLVLLPILVGKIGVAQVFLNFIVFLLTLGFGLAILFIVSHNFVGSS